MSSADVRNAINAAVTTAAAPWPVFDLSDYVNADEALSNITAETVLVQYVAADEVVASIGGAGNQGWEQIGSVVLHLIVPTGFRSAPVVAKGDAIREALRGQRLTAKVTIESCEPFVDFGGGSVGLSGGAWHGWSASLLYRRRDCG